VSPSAPRDIIHAASASSTAATTTTTMIRRRRARLPSTSISSTSVPGAPLRSAIVVS
jgi:hypothetical protein